MCYEKVKLDVKIGDGADVRALVTRHCSLDAARMRHAGTWQAPAAMPLPTVHTALRPEWAALGLAFSFTLGDACG